MINPTKQRFYWLNMQKDLFEQWCVVKIYGGIKNRNVKEIWETCDSELEASQRMFDIECIRRNRGYIYADTTHPENYILTPELI